MDRKYSKDNLKVMLAVFSYSGLEEKTHECIIQEIAHCQANNKRIEYSRVSGDALIARSRSRSVGGRFLSTDCDVVVMIDHDIVWNPGEAWDLGKLAFEQNAVVGGMYCKRTFGQGWASRISMKVGHEYAFGLPGLIEADAVATGFMAIPREILQGVIDRLDVDGGYFQARLDQGADAALFQDLSVGRIVEGAYKDATQDYYDLFRCFRLPNPKGREMYQFLSEDYAFCKRVQACGYKTYISTKPLLKHIGSHAYSVTDGMDADDRSAQCNTRSG